MIAMGYVTGSFITSDGVTPVIGAVIFEARGRTPIPEGAPPALVARDSIRVELVGGRIPPQALLPAAYLVRFRLRGAAMPSLSIDLTAAHTAAHPLDLARASALAFQH